MDDTSSTETKPKFLDSFKDVLNDQLKSISADTVEWLAVVLMHAATLPSIFGLLLGVSDRLPSIDVVSFIWTGLILFFVRALILKDMLIVMTVGVGFIIQALLLGFLVFK